MDWAHFYWVGRRVEVKDTAMSDLKGFRGVISVVHQASESVLIDIPGRGLNLFKANELIPL